MKSGMALQDLVRTVTDQERSKRDFIAPSTALAFELGLDESTDAREELVALLGETDRPRVLRVTLEDVGRFSPTAIFHRQMADKLGIPGKYYDRMATEAPELLCENVNHWLQVDVDNRMVRTLGGKARAFLSDRYRPMDNYQIASMILPILSDHGVQVQSCNVTDEAFYLKAVSPTFEGEINVGEPVRIGVVIRNSEVGLGRLSISALLYELVCRNGAIMERAVSRNHVGGRSMLDYGSDGENAGQIKDFYRDDTRRAADDLLWRECRDVTEHILSKPYLDGVIAKAKEAKGHAMTKPPQKVIEVARRDVGGWNKGQDDDILAHLVNGGSLSQWGLSRALTRMSQDVESYDPATDLERAGGKVLELSPEQWGQWN